MAGSLISGVTLATYLLVSDTWLAVHTPSTERGRQHAAEDDQQRRDRRPPAEPVPASPPPAARLGRLRPPGFTFGVPARAGALARGHLALARISLGHESLPRSLPRAH